MAVWIAENSLSLPGVMAYGATKAANAESKVQAIASSCRSRRQCLERDRATTRSRSVRKPLELHLSHSSKAKKVLQRLASHWLGRRRTHLAKALTPNSSAKATIALHGPSHDDEEIGRKLLARIRQEDL